MVTQSIYFWLVLALGIGCFTVGAIILHAEQTDREHDQLRKKGRQ